MTIQTFRKLVLTYFEGHGRHTLPWRKTKNPYKILVSEIMLQQTQVERVLPYYHAWLEKFPTMQDLAAAPLAEVLRAWQGLGYNRRAKMLHDAAKEIVFNRGGKFPKTVPELESLPGVGHYTARAVAAFAYDQDVVMIETNIRTAVTHHFFTGHEKVSDQDILVLLEKSLPKGAARLWYAALMDYGSFLKSQGIRINSKAQSYTKQKKFEGSARQCYFTVSARRASVRKITH
jgi:A/G-specific adenine glycosylase